MKRTLMIGVIALGSGFLCQSANASETAIPRDGLSLWLDADVNVFEGTFHGNNGVIHWCDVRETFADGETYADHASFAYPVASATTMERLAVMPGKSFSPGFSACTMTG